jgi:hypothetical protein
MSEMQDTCLSGARDTGGRRKPDRARFRRDSRADQPKARFLLLRTTEMLPRSKMRAVTELPPRSERDRLPWSRHTPTPWRAVRPLHIAVACDCKDSPKPIVEGLIGDGHRAFWSTRDGLIARLRELRSSDSRPLDVLIVSTRLLQGAAGGETLAALCEMCGSATLVLLGAESRNNMALAARLRRSAAFERVLTLHSPVDADDLRMLVMNVPPARTTSGYRERVGTSSAVSVDPAEAPATESD